ncbi:MAG: nicotinate-nucleotide adenylyltransferase [Peptostreptococcaceae bacterium]|nr:nicotinate-nucleotide adenylyltransferase [Peptostreptococcaceae bacterium]
MKKIGIFGGTFDPFHRLHLRIALSAKNTLGLDRLIVVPTGNPPHKNNKSISSFDHRMNMVKLSIKGLNGFSVSDIENQSRMRKSYTSDTLDYFSDRYPGDRLFFIVGSDSLFDIENWKDPPNIFRKAEIVVFFRPNISTKEELADQIRYLSQKYDANITQIEIFAEDISSTDIRSDLRDGILSSDSIHPDVKNYIKDHRLYERTDIS